LAAVPTPTPGSPASIESVAPWPPRTIKAPRSPPGPINTPRTPRPIEAPLIRTPEAAPRPAHPAHLLYLRAGRAGSQPMIERRHGRSLSSTKRQHSYQQRARHSRTKLSSRVHCLSSLLNGRKHSKLVKTSRFAITHVNG